VLNRTSGVRMAIPAMFWRASAEAASVIGIHNKFTNLNNIRCIQ
jgi:hypothetical protein